MGSGKGGKAPDVPNYNRLAQADAERQRNASQEITMSNRPNQVDRYGNTMSWERDPSGRWYQNLALSPQQKAMQDSNLAAQQESTNLIRGQGDFQYTPMGYSQQGRADIGFGNASVNPNGMAAPPPPGTPPKATPSAKGGGAVAPAGGAGQAPAVGGKGGSQAQASGTPRPAWADWEKETDLTKRLDMLNQAGMMSEIPGANPYFPNGQRGGGLSLGAGGVGGQPGASPQMGGASTYSNAPQGSQGVPGYNSQGGPATGGRADPGYFTNQAGAIGNFDATQGDKVAADVYESVMGRARPEQAREQARLDTQLRNQGLQPGTEAYNRAMQNLMTSHGDVATQAGLNSTMAGYGAARDIYNTNLAGQGQRFDQQLGGWAGNLGRQGQLTNQGLARDSLNQQGNIASEAAAIERARQTQSENQQIFGQNLTAYQLPFQRAQALAQAGQVNPLDFQGFTGATGYNPASMSNAAQNNFNAQSANANASQGKKNSLLQTGGQLGSAYLMGPA
jgi:hypothetical protein